MNINDLKRSARAVGATVEHDDPKAAGPLITNERWETYQVVAPDGMVWACSGDIHMLKVEWCTHFPEGKSEAIKDAIERISYGLAPCPDPECDYCHPAEEDR